jgi:catechol 2,3-dioxygenase-like lactoylglutathione lyase family enzyme
LTHLSLSVKDLERTLALYKRVFGAKVYITPLYTFASIMYRRRKWP